MDYYIFIKYNREFDRLPEKGCTLHTICQCSLQLSDDSSLTLLDSDSETCVLIEDVREAENEFYNLSNGPWVSAGSA